MTRDEAKQILENELKANCKTCMHPQEVGYCEHTCTYREAMETAISALQAEPKWDCTANFIAEQLEKFNEMPQGEKIEFIKRFCGIADKETKSAEPTNATENSCDLISRADAIETAKGLVMFWSDPVYRKEKESDVEDSFNDIPSADRPSGEWLDVNGDGSLWECTNCHDKACCKGNFCSECGARMENTK